MRDARVPSERYERIAGEIIRTEPSLAALRRSSARICYLSSPLEKRSHGRAVLGTCERVPERWLWAVPYDFAITIYEPNVIGLDEARIRRVLLHELLHAGIGHNKDGDEVYSIVPHDLEDFREMVDRWGFDWALS